MNRLVVLASVLWVAFGIRFVHDKIVETPRFVQPIKALSEFPSGLLGENWVERDEPLTDEIVRVAGVADYLNRSYSNGGLTMRLYVGFVSGGSTAGDHHPLVCFEAGGLRLQKQEIVHLPSGDGAELGFAEAYWQDKYKNPSISLHTIFIDGDYKPNRWKAFFTDRIKRSPWHAVITLAGDLGPSDEITRRIYTDAMLKFLAALENHLPRRDFTSPAKTEPTP